LVAADPHLVWLIDAIDHYDQTAQGGLTTQAALSGRNHSSSLERSDSKPLKSCIYNRSSTLESISLKSSQEEKNAGANAPGLPVSLFSVEAPSEGAPLPSKGTPCEPKKPTKVPDADIDAAFEAYNEVASQHGFTRCTARGEERRALLAKRLADIDGLSQFRRALTAIPRDDWLMGRISKTFKLDIEKLLSTKSGMGNVLNRLIDMAGDAAAPAGPRLPAYWWRESPSLAASLEVADWQLLYDTRLKDGAWPFDMMGPQPGVSGCVIPRDVIPKLKLKRSPQ
jgi:hypothetical protein